MLIVKKEVSADFANKTYWENYWIDWIYDWENYI